MAPAGCAWTAVSGAAWATVSPAAGTGNGTVRVTVTENTTRDDRRAGLTIGGQSVVVVQSRQPKPPKGLKIGE
jgi:hypothetical protein